MTEITALEIHPSKTNITLMGGALDAPDILLTGHVLLHLKKPTKIISLSLSLSSKLHKYDYKIWSLTSVSTQTLWKSVLLGIEHETSITLPAGTHTFPFEITVCGDMAESVETRLLAVKYSLTSVLKKPGFGLHTKIRSHKKIIVNRYHVSNEVDLFDSIMMSNSWPEHLEYQMTIDRKVVTLGQKLPIEFNLWPLFTHVKILGVKFGLFEKLAGKKGSMERWFPLREDSVSDPPSLVSKLLYVKIPCQPRITPDMSNDLISVKHQLEICILFEAKSKVKSIVLKCSLIIMPPIETVEEYLPSYSQALLSPEVILF
ncbi:hypothetical protein K7432_005414 [Basidiobolus ranarum]|uniref:Arrestin C-terminal-like domain-containing protein n=1 Tax=Basidiobolus ranarum TaxID=34480 RepID=A0ABR2WWI5_9FUNG